MPKSIAELEESGSFVRHEILHVKEAYSREESKRQGMLWIQWALVNPDLRWKRQGEVLCGTPSSG